MFTRRIARRHNPDLPREERLVELWRLQAELDEAPDRFDFEVVAPKALTYQDSVALLGLAMLLRRWHRVLDACDGDLEQARLVWDELGRLERAASQRRRRADA